jgi:predicted enzyme related to lactoylglutathione lyase
MGVRTKYEQGTFSWVDLGTTDPNAAKTFYSGLFGWEHQDMPTGEGDDDGIYTMCFLEGKPVAALSELQPQQREMGVPPMWTSYITVDDVELATARAKELGATVYMEAFDVLDAGRMSVVADPQGAVFSMWQPTSHIGAGIVNDPGCLCWNELSATDVDGAKKFYGDLFGWILNEQDFGEMTYTTARVGERGNAGIMKAMNPNIPPNWLAYFTCVGTIADSEKKVTDLGGKVVHSGIETGIGKFAIVQDPQSATFGLFEGHTDD